MKLYFEEGTVKEKKFHTVRNPQDRDGDISEPQEGKVATGAWKKQR